MYFLYFAVHIIIFTLPNIKNKICNNNNNNNNSGIITSSLVAVVLMEGQQH